QLPAVAEADSADAGPTLRGHAARRQLREPPARNGRAGAHRRLPTARAKRRGARCRHGDRRSEPARRITAPRLSAVCAHEEWRPAGAAGMLTHVTNRRRTLVARRGGLSVRRVVPGRAWRRVSYRVFALVVCLVSAGFPQLPLVMRAVLRHA